MSHCYGAVSTTLRQVTHNVPNYTYLLCNVNPACPTNTAPGHTYLTYLDSVNNKVQPPWPSTQLQLSLEHPRARLPRQLKANGRQWSHPGEDSRTQSPTTSVPQRKSATSLTFLICSTNSISASIRLLIQQPNHSLLLEQQSATQLYLLPQRPTKY